MNPPALNRRKKATVLVVEDESIVRADVEDYLKSFGYRVAASVASGEEARSLAAKLEPDLVLMDIVLSGKMDGIEAGKYIQDKLGIPVVFVTAHGDDDTLERAKLNAPFGYVLKPFNDRELRNAIEIAIFRHRTERELSRLQEWLKAILDNMEEAVMVTDKWGFITFINAHAVALTGRSVKKAVGKALDEIVQFQDGGNSHPLLRLLSDMTLQDANLASKGELLLMAADGSQIPVRFSLSPLMDSAGEINGAILKFHAVQN